MTQKCPNCKNGYLIRRGSKKSSKPRKRCNTCGYIKYDSSLAKQPGALVGSLPLEKQTRQQKTPTTEDILKESLSELRKYLPSSKEYKEIKHQRNHFIRQLRKQKSLEGIIRQLNKSKYSGLRDSKIMLEGRVWDISKATEVRKESDKQ